MTLRFDESKLTTQLSALPPSRRVAFAALVAERLAPALSSSPDNGSDSPLMTIRPITDGIWLRLSSPELHDPTEASRDVATCMQLLVDNAEKWAVSLPFAEDAVAAVAYTLRCEATGSAQEAAYAGRRGYEAIDKYVVDSSSPDLNMRGGEFRILEDVRIQGELSYQIGDLGSLLSLADQDQEGLVALREAARRHAHVFLGKRHC